MRWIMAMFGLFVIVISIMGILAPNSWVNMVISVSLVAGMLRLSLGIILLYYCLHGTLGKNFIKSCLTIYAFGLLFIFVLYLLDLTNIKLAFFDIFIIAEGGVLTLLAVSEQIEPVSKIVADTTKATQVKFAKKPLTAKNAFAQYNHLKPTR